MEKQSSNNRSNPLWSICSFLLICIVITIFICYCCWSSVTDCVTSPIQCILGDVDVGEPASCPDGYAKNTEADLFCYKKCPPGNKGKESALYCEHDTQYSTVGSDLKKSIPVCDSLKTENNGLCYDVPSGWDVTSPGFMGLTCPDNVDGQKINDSGTTCWYDRGIGKSRLGCPAGQQARGVECYDPPPDGWEWVDALQIGKICPSGSTATSNLCTYDRGIGTIPSTSCPSGQRNDGTSCWDDLKCKTVDNGHYNYTWGCGTSIAKCWDGSTGCKGNCYRTWIAKLDTSCTGCGCIKGPVTKSCPSDRILQDGLCYLNPKQGFTCGATACRMNRNTQLATSLGKKKGTIKAICNDDEEEKDGLCYKKPINYTDSSDPDTKFKCAVTVCDFPKKIKSVIGTLPTTCPDSRELKGRLCYPQCPSGYHRSSGNLEMCTEDCPTGFKDIGIGGCEKPKLELIKDGLCGSEARPIKKGARCYKI